jgi:hypothetical protein
VEKVPFANEEEQFSEQEKDIPERRQSVSTGRAESAFSSKSSETIDGGNIPKE